MSSRLYKLHTRRLSTLSGYSSDEKDFDDNKLSTLLNDGWEIIDTNAVGDYIIHYHLVKTILSKSMETWT